MNLITQIKRHNFYIICQCVYNISLGIFIKKNIKLLNYKNAIKYSLHKYKNDVNLFFFNRKIKIFEIKS